MANLSRNILVAGALCSAILVSGCSSITSRLKDEAMNKIGQGVAEKMIENASGGNVNIQNNGASFTFKDPKTGEVVSMNGSKDGGLNIQTKDGSAQIVGGAGGRPDSVPAQLPNPNGATDFAWFGSADGGMFSFKLSASDYKTACTNQLALLDKAGWKLKTDFSMEYDKTITKSLENANSTLALTCSGNDDGTVNIQMIKGKKN